MSKKVVLQNTDGTFVDTSFINSCQSVIPNSELRHMGWGEFYLRTPDGDVQFARRDEMTWEGISGRAHKIYDNRDGELVNTLLTTMELEFVKE